MTVIAVLLLGGWVLHEPILRGLAGGLIVEHRRLPATAVLLLGGDRKFDAAAGIYSAEATTIFVFRSPPDRLVRMEVLPPGDEMARKELLKRGVSDKDLAILDGNSAGRSAIAAVLGTWLENHPDQSVNVLCDRFTSRTWNLILRQTANHDLAERIHIVPLPNRQFDETNWWRSKLGTMAFLNNYISLGFNWWRSGHEAPEIERTGADFRAAFTESRG